jgi:hypothetical protein
MNAGVGRAVAVFHQRKVFCHGVDFGEGWFIRLEQISFYAILLTIL